MTDSVTERTRDLEEIAAFVPARLAYADPPYPGQSKKHYSDHPDYGGEVDHFKLLDKLAKEYDGWLLHTSSAALGGVLYAAEKVGATCRVMAWVKPWCAFKRNVSVAYAWEPVLVCPARKPEVSGRTVMRDFISEPMAMKCGLVGAKPDAVCRWGFEMMGARPVDTLDDLFPGSGAVTKAWHKWCADVSGSFGAEQLRLGAS